MVLVRLPIQCTPVALLKRGRVKPFQCRISQGIRRLVRPLAGALLCLCSRFAWRALHHLAKPLTLGIADGGFERGEFQLHLGKRVGTSCVAH